MCAIVGLPDAGSSPRGRGKHGLAIRHILERRLIPAWAGKTGTSPSTRGTAPAHPRVGGENCLRAGRWRSHRGSSPRGRGKLIAADRCRVRVRLIPAWAGKTTPRRRTPLTSRAHPRVGGENEAAIQAGADTAGSSPRGRGKRGEGGLQLVDQLAHPRVGGENAYSARDLSKRAGSSPRGRGKLKEQMREVADQRLIPAWAGKTSPTCNATPTTWAHPRVGGENGGSSVRQSGHGGSSPRGRGKQDRGDSAIVRGGLIPAWAGKTFIWSAPDLKTAAHPRVGGENHRMKSVAASLMGSSPRGRGKQWSPHTTPARGGLIPAWAGKTFGRAAAPFLRAAHPRVGGENMVGGA